MMTAKDPQAWKRSLIDRLLEAMNHINCNLGKDSTPQEVETAKEEKLKLENMIKQLDPNFFEKIKQDNDNEN